MEQKRQDYVADIDLESVNGLLSQVCEKEIHYECFEGTLLDSYIIYDAEDIEIQGLSRKYIILAVEYLNCWSSVTKMMMTDNPNMVEKYEEAYALCR